MAVSGLEMWSCYFNRIDIESLISILPAFLLLLTRFFRDNASVKIEKYDSSVELALNAPKLTVYFDGACPVCLGEIAHYRRQPGAEACKWVNAAVCAEQELGSGLSRDSALRRFHIRRANGELVDGMRGFAALWQTLPRTAWLGRLAAFGPMPAFLDGAYSVFLLVRPLWRRPLKRSASGGKP